MPKILVTENGTGPNRYQYLVHVASIPLFLPKICQYWTCPVFRSYRITNYRIDFERGWLSTTIDTMELWHVEDLKFHQSLLERMLSVGTIEIFSHDDTSPNLYMRGIPNARQLFSTLQQRIIAVKRQRGVLKLDSGT